MEATLDFHYIFVITMILFFWEFASRGIFLIVKRWMLIRIGVTKAERALMYANRQKNKFSLDKLIKKYGEKGFKRADAIGRKGVHFSISMATLIVVLTFGENMVENFLIVLIYRGMYLSVFFHAYFYEKVKWLDTLIFGPMTRVRDGIHARRNLASANAASYIQFLVIPIVLYWMYKMEVNYVQASLVIYFIYIPLAVGDAVAEIIGCFFGRQSIPVSGIGEINRKSYAGSLSVLIGSFIGIAVFVYLLGFGYQYYVLAFVTSLIAMVVELKSPRGTDNFFIPVISAVVAMIGFSVLLTSQQ